jgi:hypothetical protein
MSKLAINRFGVPGIPGAPGWRYDNQMTSGKTVQIRFSPATLSVLEQLGTKTGLARNNVIRYAIARLAEREGISIEQASNRETATH